MFVIYIYVAETKALISLRGYRGVDSHMQKAGLPKARLVRDSCSLETSWEISLIK